MGKIMNAIRHHTVAHHVGMIHAGTGPVAKASWYRLRRGDVAGHVPCGRPGRLDRIGRPMAVPLALVPQMDA